LILERFLNWLRREAPRDRAEVERLRFGSMRSTTGSVAVKPTLPRL